MRSGYYSELAAHAHASPQLTTSQSLQSNSVGNEGAQALAQALTHENNKVTELECVYPPPDAYSANHTSSLGRNNIGVDGVKALAEALTHENNKLQVLWLYSNPVGALALAGALVHKNCQIKQLEYVFPAHVQQTKLTRINSVDAASSSSAAINAALENAKVFRKLLLLLSARQVEKIGEHAAVKRLPSELIRLVGQMVKI
ncbi:hypothetical protein BASA81_001324 [Batrachochytrium salamandrivorans]|nr:hypothetical protein BASA81_001324 [Batrachochytrium salamandrivorans]